MIPEEAPIGRRPDAMVELPLSAVQRRIWLLCTSYPGNSSPMIIVANRIRGPLDVDAWLRAVGAVVDRHESLRAVFLDRPGGPVQVIGPPNGLPVTVVDLSSRPLAAAEERAGELVLAEAQRERDLARGPLVVSFLARLAPDDHVWFFAMHHLMSDGRSLPVLRHDLHAYYEAFASGREPDLPELPVRFGDFAVWQDAGHGVGSDEDLAYWLDRLAGLAVLDLPTDHPRPARKTARGALTSHRMADDLAADIESLGRAEKCTPFMVVLAGLYAVLGAWSGQDDICVGTPFTGRTRAELVPMISCLVNSLPMRADLSGDPTFAELLADTRESTLDALDHQDIPFGRVVAELDVPDDPSRAPVYSILFIMQPGIEPGGLDVSGVRVEPFPTIGSPLIVHDLIVDVYWSPTGLSTLIRYDDALFRPETIAALARRYEGLLRAAVDHPDARLSELAAR